MPSGTVPPFPWKLTAALFDDFEAVRDLTAARKVLDTYRDTVEQGRELTDEPWKLTVALFDDLEAAVRSEDLEAARKVLDKYRETVEQNR